MWIFGGLNKLQMKCDFLGEERSGSSFFILNILAWLAGCLLMAYFIVHKHSIGHIATKIHQGFHLMCE